MRPGETYLKCQLKNCFKEKYNKRTALCTEAKTNTHCQYYIKILRKQWHSILELYSRYIHIFYKYMGTFIFYNILITYNHI